MRLQQSENTFVRAVVCSFMVRVFVALTVRKYNSHLRNVANTKAECCTNKAMTSENTHPLGNVA